MQINFQSARCYINEKRGRRSNVLFHQDNPPAAFPWLPSSTLILKYRSNPPEVVMMEVNEWLEAQFFLLGYKSTSSPLQQMY